MGNDRLYLREDERVTQLLALTVDRLDQLASDALSIFSIQMVIAPVYVAATALLVSVHEITMADLTLRSILGIVNDPYTGEMVVVHMVGWSVMGTGGVLSFRTYYRARKIAQRLPNVARDRMVPPAIDRSVPDEMAGSSVFTNIETARREFDSFIDRHTHEPSLERITTRRFDAVGTIERELRATLAISLLCVPVSMILILGSYLPQGLQQVLFVIGPIIIFMVCLVIITSISFVFGSIEHLLEVVASFLTAIVSATMIAFGSAIFSGCERIRTIIGDSDRRTSRTETRPADSDESD